MNWPKASLKYVARFAYGNSIPYTNGEEGGPIRVFGSNGPYATCSEANTKSPAIVIGRKGSYGKVTWTQEPCFASDTTFFVDETTTQQHLRWLYYVLQTLKLDEGTDEAAVPGLNRDRAYEKVVFVPPPPEQRAIAAYLDRETSKIGALITEKERLLSLLAEKRRALITQAVTRGPNPDMPMHNSGTEWLGEIPRHWKTVRIKHVAKVGNGSTPLRDNESYWKDGSFPWLTSTVVNDDIVGEPTEFVTEKALRECHLPIIQPDSVLIAITGEGKTRGKASWLRYDATINQHLAFISPQKDLLYSDFLQLALSASYEILRMISEGTGSTKGALTCEQVGEFLIPLPPLAEQRKILSDISSVKVRIDALAEGTEEMIALLHERRVALTSAAVTGQIRVRVES